MKNHRTAYALTCTLLSCLLLNGCAMCIYDTVSKPSVVDGRGLHVKTERKTNAAIVKYPEFDMSIQMYNSIPSSNDLFVIVILPIPSTNKNAKAKFDDTIVRLTFEADEKHSGLASHGIQIQLEDVELLVDKKRTLIPSTMRLKDKIVSSKNERIVAYNNSTVDIYFGEQWDPKSDYLLTIRQIIYGESGLPFPTIEFSKGQVTQSCESAP